MLVFSKLTFCPLQWPFPFLSNQTDLEDHGFMSSSSKITYIKYRRYYNRICSMGKKNCPSFTLIFQKFKRNVIFKVFIYWYHTIKPTGRSVQFTRLDQNINSILARLIINSIKKGCWAKSANGWVQGLKVELQEAPTVFNVIVLKTSQIFILQEFSYVRKRQIIYIAVPPPKEFYYFTETWFQGDL